jgi:hypothetical protein
MDAQKLQTSLSFAHAAGLVMLLRSIAYDRWISVLLAAMLLAGVEAARRNRTWGIALAFAAAAAFPVFVAIGIAPSWFLIVGALGMLPFGLASRAFARFDKGATVLLAGLGASIGALVAVGWNQIAPWLFYNLPFVRPSYGAQHILPVAALAGFALAVSLMRKKQAEPAAEGARVRIGERVRVATPNDADLAYAGEFDEEEEAVERPRSHPNTKASAATRDASSHQPARDHASRS